MMMNVRFGRAASAWQRLCKAVMPPADAPLRLLQRSLLWHVHERQLRREQACPVTRDCDS
jgi:cytochrome c-type biogenesis protein CcmH/NrfG